MPILANNTAVLAGQHVSFAIDAESVIHVSQRGTENADVVFVTEGKYSIQRAYSVGGCVQMFIHQNQLEYLLEPAHYTDPYFLKTEVDRLFLPAWHLIGSKADLPREGDFLTREILGQPLIVRREQGYHCFLNVCSHRHCKLTSLPCGNDERLSCQYHGWQYKMDGYTSKIPDARCFRPFDRANARLHKFRLEECGDLLFVSLADSGPSLREHLGNYFDLVDELFRPPYQQIWTWEKEFDCNWKVPVENTVETYHLPSVHKGYFSGVYPSEGAQTHELNDRYSTLTYDLSEDPKVTRNSRRVLKALGGRQPDDQYRHHIRHPNLVFATSDLFLHAQVYLPVSATRTLTIVRFFAYQGTNKNPWAWFNRRISNWVGRKMDLEVQTEDARVFDQAQQGIEKTRYKGCLGTREERIYVFHNYIHQRCCREQPDRANRVLAF